MLSSLARLRLEREESSAELTRAAEQLQHQLATRTEELQGVVAQLAAARSELQDCQAGQDGRLARDREQERERAAQHLHQFQARSEAERRELESKASRIQQQLENRVASLDVQNRDLIDTRYRHEASLREVRAALAAREEELTRRSKELEAVRAERQQVGSLRYTANQIVCRLSRLDRSGSGVPPRWRFASARRSRRPQKRMSSLGSCRSGIGR